MRVFALALSVAAATLLGACSGGNSSPAGLLLPSAGSAFQAQHCPQSGALRNTTCATAPRLGVPSDGAAIQTLNCPQSTALRGTPCATAPRLGVPAETAQNTECRRSTAFKDPVCTVNTNHPRSTVTRDDPALRIINHCDQRATALEPCKPPRSTVILRP